MKSTWCRGCGQVVEEPHNCEYVPKDLNETLRGMARDSLYDRSVYSPTQREIDIEIERVIEALFKMSNLGR